MRDRERLIDPAWRAGVDGAEELYVALSGAIGHNLFQTRLDYPVKNDLWMVLYLNRMLCARFGLPLGYGGFRERPLEEVCKWMSHRPPDEEDLLGDLLAGALGRMSLRWESPFSARGPEEVAGSGQSARSKAR